MATRFVTELKEALESHAPERVSFIGHSLGNLIIRTALARPDVQALFETSAPQGAADAAGAAPSAGSKKLPQLVTYVSFAAPHAGAIYLGGVVSTGMWIMSRWKRSASLSALAWTDHSDPRQTFIYKLSTTTSLELFRNVVLVASPQDKYVNIASALLHTCPQSAADRKYGTAFDEVVRNILKPLDARED
eukprot:CAMPEP_0182933280 /NCGR_PEP_ID=MMETSP0105_2-20130417/33525_1 /TAXON_ID=81532 ORGANISM="Acanthoeca-like sp., Strain 10tr" /NCGR_SAMPLE_ID=MMETSP0105_2 /ASSEMBLY_ACC=CAM_ASM_000205 /LENGTH=189 /DNA_ID=CAMNT_0025071987 /DNA_START=31 /DNA_END=597 /DNA_ORIENTATION=-